MCLSGPGEHISVPQGSKERAEFSEDLVERAKAFTVTLGGELIR